MKSHYTKNEKNISRTIPQKFIVSSSSNKIKVKSNDSKPTSTKLSLNSNNALFLESVLSEKKTEESENILFSVNKFRIPYSTPKQFLNKKRKKPNNLFVIKSKEGKKIDSFGNEINENKWTFEENLKLFEAIIQFGNNWKEIKAYVNSRTIDQLYSRTQKLIKNIKKFGEIKGFNFENISMTNLNDLIETIKKYDENTLRFFNNMYIDNYELKREKKQLLIQKMNQERKKIIIKKSFEARKIVRIIKPIPLKKCNIINYSSENNNFNYNLMDNSTRLVCGLQQGNNTNSIFGYIPNNNHIINNFNHNSYIFKSYPYDNYNGNYY